MRAVETLARAESLPGTMCAMSTTAPSTGADAAFRVEVATFRGPDRLRSFPLGVHAGVPDGPRRRLEVPWPVPRSYDAGLRLDLAEALVDALLPRWPSDVACWGWVTRPGRPELHDCDLGWLAALRHAVGVHDLELAGFRAVTRTGWLDVLTGERRTWKRLRI